VSRQRVWGGPGGTRFSVPCEACLEGREDGSWSVSVGWRRVEGVLRPGTDVALLACKRGHPVVVRRAGELARTG